MSDKLTLCTPGNDGNVLDERTELVLEDVAIPFVDEWPHHVVFGDEMTIEIVVVDHAYKDFPGGTLVFRGGQESLRESPECRADRDASLGRYVKLPERGVLVL